MFFGLSFDLISEFVGVLRVQHFGALLAVMRVFRRQPFKLRCFPLRFVGHFTSVPERMYFPTMASGADREIGPVSAAVQMVFWDDGLPGFCKTHIRASNASLPALSGILIQDGFARLLTLNSRPAMTVGMLS